MTMKRNSFVQPAIKEAGSKPMLNIRKIGIVSRDYGIKFSNGYKDFSESLPRVLKFLDENGCDAVLFSLFSITPRKRYDPRKTFGSLKNIEAVLLEVRDREKESNGPSPYIVHHHTPFGWTQYELHQQFGTIKNSKEIHGFAKNEIPRRILGNCCVLLCGETNGVKYSKADKKVHDTFGVRKAIPKNTNIIFNPIHDRMTRFEMKLKRNFLSKSNRWVISVWNKGKKDKNGKTRDGHGPAWTIFYNCREREIAPIRKFGVDIGIVDINSA